MEFIKDYPVKSLTNDNGMEFYDFKNIQAKTGVPVYFATPYSSWERGSVENSIKHLRRFFPKGYSLKDEKSLKFNKAQKWLNSRPMKVLGYRTPEEVFNKKTDNFF